MSQLDNYVALLVKIILAIAISLTTKYLIPLFKVWYEEKVDNKIKKVIKEAVEAAEQTIKGSGMGTAKKEEVLEMVIEFMEEHGYDIDDNKLNMLIESAVFAMNLNKNKSEG